jgi:hypothetical protein
MPPKSQANIRKSSANNDKSKSSTNWTSLFLKHIGNIAKVAGVIFVIVFAYTLYKQSKSAIRNLVNTNADTLKDVFFGEQPFVFYCDRGTGPATGNDNAVTTVPALFTDLHALLGTKMGFATLNCSQVLPSGKSIWDRFKLKKEMKPVIWGNAPWTTPKQAMGNHMKDVKTLQTYMSNALVPKGTKISSQKQLMKFCQFDEAHFVYDDRDIPNTCIVLMKGKKHTKSQTELEQKIILAYPKTKFVSIQSDSLRFSFENLEFLTPENFALRLYAIRNGTHSMEMLNPPTWDYANTFISSALSAPMDDYQGEGSEPWKLMSPNDMKKYLAKKSKREEKKKTDEEDRIKQRLKNRENDRKAPKKAPESPSSKPTSSKSSPGSTKSSGSKSSSSTSSSSSKKTRKQEEEEEDSYEEDAGDDGEDATEEEVIELSDEDIKKAKQERLAREQKIREDMEKASRAHLYDEVEN